MTALATPAARRRQPFPQYLLEQQIGLALVLWPLAVAVVGLIILGVARVAEIEVSIWDEAKAVAQWYALFIGVHVGWSILPLLVTHGRTRREFMDDVLTFVPVFAAALALMVTLTFLAEAGLYRLTGWPQEVQSGQLYDSALQVHLVFLQSWLLIGLWTAGGAFIGSAWYRHDGLGGLAVAAGIVFAGISGIAFSSDWGPFGAVYERFSGDDAIPGPLGVIIHLACITLILALTWLTVRTMAIRNRPA